MRSRATSVVGNDAVRVREQLNQWRQDHSGRGRIPEVLWGEAVRLACEQGLHKTARLLGLDYYSLKKRLQAGSAPAMDSPSSPAFIELQPTDPSAAFECILELQNAQGTQLKLHLRGSAAPDLTAPSDGASFFLLRCWAGRMSDLNLQIASVVSRRQVEEQASSAPLDVSRDKWQRMLEHARGGGLADVEYEQLKAAVDTLVSLTQLVEDKSTTIARLRELLFGITPEKTAKGLQQVAAKAAAANNSSGKEEESSHQAAQGEVLHNDDTPMKVLVMMKENRETANKEDQSERSGIFTSGIVSTHAGQKIALFFTGRKHAGENLTAVLAERAKELGPPIQMCDALSRNLPADFQTVVANCIAHGRRKFVEVAARFPEECIHVLQSLGEVYKHDAYCRDQEMSPQERLDYHRTQSAPLMDKLKDWFQKQFEEHLVDA